MAFADTIEAAAAKIGGKTDRLALRRRLLIALGGAVLLVAVAWGVWWYIVASHYVSTDDAYVDASLAEITPQIDGTIAQVPVSDTNHVKRGDVLVVIDPADAELAVAQARANYGQAIHKVRQYFANADQAAAEVAARQADLARAETDFSRRAGLARTGAVSGDEISTAGNALQTAKANLEAAKEQLASQKALIDDGDVAHNPEVLAAKAALDKANLDLSRTIIRAPIDGIVAQNGVQIGQRVKVGAILMSVVPVAEAHVNANFKEGQLDRVRAGEPATLTSDLYGSGVVFHGRVIGVGGGTGAAFATIPAQNATGNWIKVVQRVPVRIALDPKELADHPLRVGLSMSAKIDIAH
jgi:membrane fusion protein (multidrug efflux system)